MRGDAGIEALCQDIAAMRIRGATRIGLAAADGFADLAQRATGPTWRTVLAQGARALVAARPTAVALPNAVARVAGPALAAKDPASAGAAAVRALSDLRAWMDEGRAIARHGAERLADGGTVLTHCNSATAVAVLKAAHAAGHGVRVVATETRPWRQGMLTVKALAEAGLSCTYVVDSAAGILLDEGRIDAVLVGADTVSCEGSLVNKVGTSLVALAAADAGVPVFCATSALKFTHAHAADIPIERRAASEVVAPAELPAGVAVDNPVFDHTPASRITSYITEHGTHAPHDAVRRALADVPEVYPW